MSGRVTVMDEAGTEAPAPAPAKTRTLVVGGRSVVMRNRLSHLQNMLMAEAIPRDLQGNMTWQFYAETAFSVVSIDGEAISLPRSKAQIEARISLLGDDVVDALMAEFNAKLMEAAASMRAAATGDTAPGTQDSGGLLDTAGN